MTTLTRGMPSRDERTQRFQERPTVPIDEVAPRHDDRWMILAAATLGLAGALQFIYGAVALNRPAFLVSEAQFVFGDVRTWGWIGLPLGALAAIAAVVVTTRSEFGRWFGVAIAATQAMAALMMIQSYPPWCLSIFALDLLAILSLAMYQTPRPILNSHHAIDVPPPSGTPGHR